MAKRFEEVLGRLDIEAIEPRTGAKVKVRRKPPTRAEVTAHNPGKRFTHQRLRDPQGFKKRSFRTVKVGKKRIIIGRPKGSEKTRAQAILRPKKSNPGIPPFNIWE